MPLPGALLLFSSSLCLILFAQRLAVIGYNRSFAPIMKKMIDMPSIYIKIVLLSWLFSFVSMHSMAQSSVPNILQPERELPLLPEVVADDIVSVPAVGVKPLEDDGGATIPIKQFVINYDQPAALIATQSAGAKQLTVDYLAQYHQQLNLAQLDDLVFAYSIFA